MKINFEFKWWKLIFIGLEMSLVLFAFFVGGIIPAIIGYLIVGFLICLVSEFVYPKILLTWAIEFWKKDIEEPFFK